MSSVKVSKYSELYEQINHSTLATYEIRRNEIYRDMVETMDNDMRAPVPGVDE